MKTTELTYNSKSYVTIPETLIGVTPKQAFVYAKLKMLRNKVYTQTALVKTPGKIKPDMTPMTFSNMVRGLQNKGFLTVSLEERPGFKNPINIYHIATFEGYFKGIYFDFINYPDLSPEAKGFGILLHLLKEKPTSFLEISKMLHISDKSSKKYYLELVEKGFIVNGCLSEEYFPDLISESYKQKYIDYREDLLKITSDRIKKQIEWLDELQMSYNWKFTKLREIEAGMLTPKKIEKEINKFNLILE